MKMQSNVSFTIMGFASERKGDMVQKIESQVSGLKVQKIEKLPKPIPAHYKVTGIYTTEVEAKDPEEGALKAMRNWLNSNSDRMFWKVNSPFIPEEQAQKKCSGRKEEYNYEK